MYHRKSFGAGQWGFEFDDLSVDFFGVGYARKSRNGLDWGFNYKTIDVKTNGETTRYWSSDLGLILHIESGVGYWCCWKKYYWVKRTASIWVFIAMWCFDKKSIEWN